MRKLIIVFFVLIEFVGISAQERVGKVSNGCLPLKEFVDSITWDANEAKFVYDFSSNVTPSSHEEWDFENSESNFSLTNVCVDNIKVEKSYVRVSKKTKKILRINLIFINQGNDEKTASAIIESVLHDFGKPLKIEEERSRFIEGFTKTYYWESPDYEYKVELIHMVDPNGKQDVIVNLEPYY